MILRSLLIVYEYSYSGMCILIVGVFLHSYVYSYDMSIVNTSLFNRALLQKRPMILRRLLIVYEHSYNIMCILMI